MYKIILLLVLVTLTGCDLIKKEVGPTALLRKYEWFKNASAEADKRMADIEVYKSRQAQMDSMYVGKPRREWDRIDKEQYNQWAVEVAGVIASYNSIAAEYNAQMSKMNWRFTNVGDLPAGATVVLPREIKPYLTK